MASSGKAKAISHTIKPLDDRIVVTRTEPEQTTTGGIILPENAKEKPQQGEVVAAGPGRLDDNGKRVPLEVGVGDRILYAKYTGTEVKLDNNEYIVLNEKDVLAKLVV